MSTKLPKTYFRNIRPEILERFPRVVRKVLEVGCGEGHFGSALLSRKLAEQVYGIEPSEEASQGARARLTGVYCGVVESLTSAPSEFSGPFDCIVLNDVIEHTVDPEAVLAQLKPLLAPNGFFVASIPNIQFHKVLRRLVFHGEWTYTDQGVLDRTHLRFFTAKSAVALFKKFDFVPVKVEGINSAPFPRWLSIMNVLSGKRFENMRYQQFFMHFERWCG